MMTTATTNPIKWARLVRDGGSGVVIAVDECRVGELPQWLPKVIVKAVAQLKPGVLALRVVNAELALTLAKPPRSQGSRTEGNLLPW